jgi:hypothetical protein
MSAASATTSCIAALALAIVAAACASSGAVVQAPVVELAIAPIGSASAAPAVRSVSGTESRCSVRLSAGKIEKSSAGCYLDEHISKGPGILYYPCSGDGPAEATFGTQRYGGRISGGDVEVQLEGELDWEDGCRWGTSAKIGGTLVPRPGGPLSKGLTWTYRDRVITGSGCSGVCTAKSALQVSSSAGTSVKPTVVEEDEDDDD